MAYNERYCATSEVADRVKEEIFLGASKDHQEDQKKPGAQDLAWHIRRQVARLPTNLLLALAVDAELMCSLLDSRMSDERPVRSFLYDSIVQKLWPWAK